MKRVLFSHSYFYKYDKKQWDIAEPYPPLMTITAASYLREHEFEVDLFDTALLDSPDGLTNKLEEYKPDYFVIFDDGFNYLTKMCLTSMREAAFEMQRMAKSFGATVICCSSDSTDNYLLYLQNKADFVIKGEGEVTLLELINCLESNGEVSEVNGIYFNSEEGIKFSGNRPVNQNLDNLPMAAWDLIDIQKYRKIWESKNRPLYLNIATTRGCPYKCNWCAKPIYGNRYNSRSVEKVVDEIEYHIVNHSVNHFWMCDDIFALKPKWANEFENEISKRKLKIKFKIQSRADLLLKENNINALVKAGLDEVWIGAESGSQRILDAMDKGTTLEQISESTSLLKQKGVKVAFFIQFGYLGELQEDIQKTIKMVLDIMPDKIGVSVSYPLPGTKFYETVKNDLSNKSNWTDSDDLDMMFHNTYQPKFYKKLHRYLHNRYRVKRSILTFRKLIQKPGSLSIQRIRHVLAIFLHLPQGLINKVKLNYLANSKL